jgi:hypothetical protein
MKAVHYRLVFLFILFVSSNSIMIVPVQPMMASTQPSKAANAGAKAFAREKLAQMTLEEKVLLLTGQDLWRTNAIPRLGISRMKTSDGPVGVRGGIFTDGVKTASAPTGYASPSYLSSKL